MAGATRSKRRALQHWLLVFCEKKVLAMNTQQEPTLKPKKCFDMFSAEGIYKIKAPTSGHLYRHHVAHNRPFVCFSLEHLW